MTVITQSTTSAAGDPAPARRRASSRDEPIIGGFHPDPSVCRVGEDFYLANSSFEYTPGVPLWHSRDLIRWTQIGNALGTADQLASGQARSSQGIYAPTLRHRDGKFWLITTNVSGVGGQLLTSAIDPRGPWVQALTIEGLAGIDPDLAWDDDGTCYVTFCSSQAGAAGIAQARVDLEHGVRLEEPRLLWQGTGLAFPEGPHLYKKDDWWYLLIAEGGTERGHSVSVARSRNITGPFEGAPQNPIFTHRSTPHPVQNTGHADLVQGLDGQWAAVYLGVRPRGATPMFHVNGRETFLAGVDWVHGWPRFIEDQFSFDAPDRSFDEDFAGTRLHPRWVSPGAAPADFVDLSLAQGLTVRPAEAVSGETSALMARITDHGWRFEARLRTTAGSAGVLLRLDDKHWCEVRVDGGRAHAVLHIGQLEDTIGAVVYGEPAETVVVVESLAATQGGPDDIALGVRIADSVVPLARFDGRYLSTEVAGGFTGRMVGFRAVTGTIDVLDVRYRATDAYPAAEPE